MSPLCRFQNWKEKFSFNIEKKYREQLKNHVIPFANNEQQKNEKERKKNHLIVNSVYYRHSPATALVFSVDRTFSMHWVHLFSNSMDKIG